MNPLKIWACFYQSHYLQYLSSASFVKRPLSFFMAFKICKVYETDPVFHMHLSSILIPIIVPSLYFCFVNQIRDDTRVHCQCHFIKSTGLCQGPCSDYEGNVTASSSRPAFPPRFTATL